MIRNFWNRFVKGGGKRPRAAKRFTPRLEYLEDRAVPATFTVTNTLDAGAGSLRQAVLQSNATPGSNTINFGITAGSTIALQTALTVTNTVTIDGSFGGTTPQIILTQASGAVSDGIDVINTGGVNLRGLVLNGFTNGNAVKFQGGGGNTIQECYIGTDLAGNNAAANKVGVEILNSSFNGIGSNTSASAGNVISGNTFYGIDVNGPGSAGNVILNNKIGTNLAGTQAVANGDGAFGSGTIPAPLHGGVFIEGGASNNTIGFGTTFSANNFNVISGNNGFGVEDSAGSGNFITDNFIGTNAAGTSALGNTDGVDLINGTANNSVGGAAGGSGNVISGNNRMGVFLANTGTNGNTVQQNDIGVQSNGTTAIGNILDGVAVVNGASRNEIQSNFIAGNHNFGVGITDSGSNANIVRNNTIGESGAPNALDGVIILNGAANNLVTNDSVEFNGRFGVTLWNQGATTTGNLVQNSSIFSNIGHGVVIGGGAQNNTIGGGFQGNSIFSNGGDGVAITAQSNSGTSNNAVQGNSITNNVDGVIIIGAATGNTIGGTQGSTGNNISNNTRYGVVLTGEQSGGSVVSGSGPSGNLVQGNSINTNASHGVVIADGAHNNTVGTATPNPFANVSATNTLGRDAQGNLIIGNGRDGILVSGDPTQTTPPAQVPALFTLSAGVGNTLYDNGIWNNSLLGIDDLTDTNLNFQPTLTTAGTVGGQYVVTGTARANTTYTIQVYANPPTDTVNGVPISTNKGPGQGRFLLGAATVTTDSSGNFSLAVANPNTFLGTGQFLSATATDSAGTTSRFSQDILAGA